MDDTDAVLLDLFDRVHQAIPAGRRLDPRTVAMGSDLRRQSDRLVGVASVPGRGRSPGGDRDRDQVWTDGGWDERLPFRSRPATSVTVRRPPRSDRCRETPNCSWDMPPRLPIAPDRSWGADRRRSRAGGRRTMGPRSQEQCASSASPTTSPSTWARPPMCVGSCPPRDFPDTSPVGFRRPPGSGRTSD